MESSLRSLGAMCPGPPYPQKQGPASTNSQRSVLNFQATRTNERRKKPDRMRSPYSPALLPDKHQAPRMPSPADTSLYLLLSVQTRPAPLKLLNMKSHEWAMNIHLCASCNRESAIFRRMT